MDTATLTTTPTTVVEVDPAVRERLEALAATLTGAAEQLHGDVANLDTAGARRRGHKLVRQVHAAARLVARGAHLAEPTDLRRVELAVGRLGFAPTDTTQQIDGHVEVWRSILVGLHRWRGHTSSLPAED